MYFSAIRCILGCCLLPTGVGQAQQLIPRLLQQFSKPTNANTITKSILEDDQGNLWLATGNGVYRYSKHRFKEYHIKQHYDPHDFNLRPDHCAPY